MKAKIWFYAQGASLKSRGLPLKASPMWPYRNQMRYWAWLALTAGYQGFKCPTQPLFRVTKSMTRQKPLNLAYASLTNFGTPDRISFSTRPGYDNAIGFNAHNTRRIIGMDLSTDDRTAVVGVDGSVTYLDKSWGRK